MKEDDALPVSTPTAAITAGGVSSISKKDSSMDSILFGRGRFKFWALAAILLLAFWSMLTGTVSLRFSAGNLNHFYDDIRTPVHDDLDVLEMEEREKVVKHCGMCTQIAVGSEYLDSGRRLSRLLTRT